MKKLLFLSLSAAILMISCSKDDNPTTAAVSYMSVNSGETRYFELKDSISGNLTSIIQTSSNRDTMVSGKSYHVFENNNGSYEYFAVSGNDYYTLYNLPSTISSSPIELLYLKSNAAVGSNWAQNFSFSVPGVPIPIPVTFTHTVKEKGLSRTTGTITHSNVMRVETKISSSLLSINSDIQSYIAPKYGVVHMTTYIEESTAGINILTRRTMTGANF